MMVPMIKTATASRKAGRRPVTKAISLETGWASVIPSKNMVLKLRVCDRVAPKSSATIYSEWNMSAEELVIRTLLSEKASFDSGETLTGSVTQRHVDSKACVKVMRLRVRNISKFFVFP